MASLFDQSGSTGSGRGAVPGRAPLRIPETHELRYISFMAALNLRLPDEDTGDWHFEPVFLPLADEGPQVAPLAGQGLDCDTTDVLGDRGVRDMRAVLEARDVFNLPQGPVWVADHHRAVADLALDIALNGQRFDELHVSVINSWFDTEEQIAHLRMSYLEPLLHKLDAVSQGKASPWLEKIKYD